MRVSTYLRAHAHKDLLSKDDLFCCISALLVCALGASHVSCRQHQVGAKPVPEKNLHPTLALRPGCRYEERLYKRPLVRLESS